ncbi:chromosome transmission fidelity protein 4, partial [Phenoliferia sp. Uapishka_3]
MVDRAPPSASGQKPSPQSSTANFERLPPIYAPLPARPLHLPPLPYTFPLPLPHPDPTDPLSRVVLLQTLAAQQQQILEILGRGPGPLAPTPPGTPSEGRSPTLGPGAAGGLSLRFTSTEAGNGFEHHPLAEAWNPGHGAAVEGFNVERGDGSEPSPSASTTQELDEAQAQLNAWSEMVFTSSAPPSATLLSLPASPFPHFNSYDWGSGSLYQSPQQFVVSPSETVENSVSPPSVSPTGRGSRRGSVSNSAPAARRGSASTSTKSKGKAKAKDADADVDDEEEEGEEDKRKRNTAASARFRAKKKQRDAELQQTSSQLRERLGDLEKQASAERAPPSAAQEHLSTMQAVNPKISILDPHADGASHLTFSPDGHYLYTTGDEGYIRIFDSSDSSAGNANPILVAHFDEPITSVSASKEFWCASSEDGQVKVMTAGKEELARALTRCTLPARSARFDHKGKWIAVASDEVLIKVVNSTNPMQAFVLTGHKKGVRDATWSPDDTLVTSTDQDGELRVWEIGGGEPTCIQVFENLVFAGPTDLALPMGALWHPSGKYFAVVSKDNGKTNPFSTVVYEDAEFASQKSSPSTATAGVAADHSQVPMVTPANGKYLISAGKGDNVIVWSESSRQPVIWTKASHHITDISFHPIATANTLAWVDIGGHLNQWKDVLPSHLPDPSLIPSSKRDRSVSRAPSNGAKPKKGRSGFVDDQASGEDLGDDGNDDEDEDGEDGKRLEREDWIEDDLENEFGEDAQVRKRSEAVGDWAKGSGTEVEKSYTSSYVSSSKGQDPFQPGSTPLKDKKRYLAFNMIGNIQVIEREDQNIVTVDFHDQSTHLGFHFNDTFKYNIGAIGELGSIFACRSSGADSPAMIYYRPYDSWSKATEWQYSLSPGENVVALAVGGMAEPADPDEMSIAGTGCVVVATDKGYLRYFTGSGIQRRVEHFDDGDDVVAMAASKDWLFIVMRSGPVQDSKQNLSYVVVDMDTFETFQKGKVPMKKGATLKWIGFSDEQIPAMYDSVGVLSMLDCSRHPGQGKWLVALEMHELARREGKDETYWPIGVNDKHVNAIILKGRETAPGFPTPLFQDIELQFPLLRQDVPQGQLEEQYARETMFIANRRDGCSTDDFTLKTTLSRQELETDKYLLKIMQTACKAENLQAAFDATLLLSQSQSLVAASKIAAFFRLPALEERIRLAAEEKDATRDSLENNKREHKWTHRIDERRIPHATNAGQPSSSGWFSATSTPAIPTSTPRANHTQPPSRRPPPSILSSREKKRAMMEQEAAFGGSDDIDPDDSMQVDDGFGSQDERDQSPQAYRSDGDDDGQEFVEEPEEMMAPPPLPKATKAANPFRKVAAPKAAPPAVSANAIKKGSKTDDIKRTGSFFGRVEAKGTEPTKGGKKGTKTSAAAGTSKAPAASGATLDTFFGRPATTVPALSAKKRKIATPAATGPVQKKLSMGGAFRKDEQSTEGERENSPLNGDPEVEEADAGGSLPPVDEEVEMEDTQVEETQVEPEKENTPVTEGRDGGDGVSKLAQFRAATAAATA